MILRAVFLADGSSDLALAEALDHQIALGIDLAHRLTGLQRLTR